jgi:hypothetical protein
VVGQVVTFFTADLGLPIPSPALVEKIGNRFRREVKAFAAENDIPILQLKEPDRTRFEVRKLDHVRPDLEKAERDGRLGVVCIVTAQEFQWVFSAKKRRPGDRGTRLTGSRTDHGLQADRVRPDPLACHQRSATHSPRPRRCRLRKRG